MKKIILLSDTHGYLDEQMLAHMRKADEVWHAGDIGGLDLADKIKKVATLRAVHGNIDDHKVRSEFHKDLRFTIEKMTVWITHIGGYPKNYHSNIKLQLANNAPQLFICGHSHILKIIYDKKYKLLHLNPGAAGKHGIHQVRTMLYFEVHNDTLKEMKIIELSKRI